MLRAASVGDIPDLQEAVLVDPEATPPFYSACKASHPLQVQDTRPNDSGFAWVR